MFFIGAATDHFFAAGRAQAHRPYGGRRAPSGKDAMEVHQLRYFRAVARNGTFTRASEMEHVAQPSLSQQIRKLGEELGARLFDRTPRSAKLTVFGRAFLPRAEKQEKGVVAVGVIPTIAAYLLPRILNGFSALHPGVNVRVMEEITPVLLDRLHAGDIDMAIVAVPIENGELVCADLFEERFFAVVPEKHAKAGRRRLSLAELRKERFLLLKEGHCFRDSLMAACQESRMRPNVVFESGHFSTILAMVSAGTGVYAVPAMAAEPHAGCRYIPLSNRRGARRIGLIRDRNRFETRSQRVLRDHVIAVSREIRPEAAARRLGKTGSALVLPS
jgi:LysR family hydrogen peroxide-inducible transcriptional activator